MRRSLTLLSFLFSCGGLLRAAIGNITVDDTDLKAIKYAGIWQHMDKRYGVIPWYNSSKSRSVWPKNTATFEFTGTYVAWHGAWRKDGTCFVGLDGADQRARRPDIDGFESGELMWERGGLPNKRHTLQITVGPEGLVDCWIDRFVFTSLDVPPGANTDTDPRGAGGATSKKETVTSKVASPSVAPPDSTPPPTSHTSTGTLGAIVGAAIGGVVIVGFGLGFLWNRIQNKKEAAQKAAAAAAQDMDASTADLKPASPPDELHAMPTAAYEPNPPPMSMPIPGQTYHPPPSWHGPPADQAGGYGGPMWTHYGMSNGQEFTHPGHERR